MRRIFILAFLTIYLLSCNKGGGQIGDIAPTFTATFPSEWQAGWQAGDEIAICDGSTIETIRLTDADISGADASIEPRRLSTEAAQYYAVFPASCAYYKIEENSVTSFLAEGGIQLAPSEGGAVYKSYAISSGNSLKFKPLGAIVHLSTARYDVCKIVLKSAGGAYVQSNVTVDPHTGAVSRSGYRGSSSVECAPDAKGNGYLGVNAGKYSGGFSITAYNSAGSSLGTATLSEDLNLSDGQIFEISDFDGKLGSQQDVPTLPTLGSHRSFSLSGVSELSGLCLSKDGDFLWGVGDSGTLYKISFDGKSSAFMSIDADMEAITIDPASGDLFIATERDQKALRIAAPGYDKVEPLWAVQEAVDGDFGNDGLEGIAWYRDGQLYIGSQKGCNLWKYRLDGTKLARTSLSDLAPQMSEIADLCYDAQNDFLWAVDSKKFKLFLFNGTANKLLATYDISGMTKNNPESVCVDDANHCIWIADDDKTSVLYRIDLK